MVQRCVLPMVCYTKMLDGWCVATEGGRVDTTISNTKDIVSTYTSASALNCIGTVHAPLSSGLL